MTDDDYNALIKHIDRRQLGYESYSFLCGFDFPLPIKYDRYKKNDKEVFDSVFEILDKGKSFSAQKVGIKTEYGNNIIVTYRYEGNSGYYDFDLVFYLVYVTDKDEIMLCGSIEQGVHDLFEDIITDKILPQWMKDLKLTR